MDFTKLNAFLETHGQKLGIPGQSCMVSIDDKIVYERYMGYADL